MRLKYLALAAVGTLSYGLDAPDEGREILQKSVMVTEADWAEAPGYAFVKREVKTKHGSETKLTTSEVLMIEGTPYERMIAEDGLPSSVDKQAEESRKLEQEILKRQHESPHQRSNRIAKYAADRDRDHAMLKELAEAFDYSVAGTQNLNGHDVWVLNATPKPGYVPATREAKVVSSMKVKLWIDQTTYQWARIEAEVATPVSLYGILARVDPGTKFVLDQEPVSRGVWLPKHFSMNVNAEALGFINKSIVEDHTFSNYRPMSQLTVGKLTGGATAEALVEPVHAGPGYRMNVR